MVHGRLSLVRLAGAALAGASCLAAGACGAGGTSSAGPAATASSVSSAADPLASLSAEEVATKAEADLEAEPNVTMSGTVTEAGARYILDLGLRPGHGCTGTIGTSKGDIKLTVIGTTVYFNPDDKFWKANAGSAASSVIAIVSGRYIKTSTANKSMGSLSALCDLSKSIGSAPASGELSKGAVTSRDGVRVLTLDDSSDGSTADVTDTSKPEIVAVSGLPGSSDGSGTLTFSTATPVKLVAPPASQVIDGSKVGL